MSTSSESDMGAIVGFSFGMMLGLGVVFTNIIITFCVKQSIPTILVVFMVFTTLVGIAMASLGFIGLRDVCRRNRKSL